MSSKTESFFGLCRRAGALLPGHDAVFGALRNGGAYLVLLTSDASDRHRRELEAGAFGVETLTLKAGSEETSYMTGKRCCIYAVTNPGLAQQLVKSLKEEGYT